MRDVRNTKLLFNGHKSFRNEKFPGVDGGSCGGDGKCAGYNLIF